MDCCGVEGGLEKSGQKKKKKRKEEGGESERTKGSQNKKIFLFF